MEKKVLSRPKFDDEHYPTESSEAQKVVEHNIEEIYLRFKEKPIPSLNREAHLTYLEHKLGNLGTSFEKLEASRTWLCYWSLHALALLKHEVSKPTKRAIIEFLKKCQNKDGGFGGGPYQYSHMATTYAAVNALVVLGTTEALESIDRDGLLKFLWAMRVGDGSFYMQAGGEIDVRSVYCALAVAKITNIYSPELFENSIEWLVMCQSYEGGFSGEPGMEAHGGYTFCAVAALVLLNSYKRCDIKSLLRWTVNRQMKFEGGFQGRTNKLVDSCYSFWQSASLTMANMALLTEKGIDKPKCESWLLDNELLQDYVLICCQNQYGGFMDKPTCRVDPYHSCYALSGLAISQNINDDDEKLLAQTHPAYNLPMDKLTEAIDFFYGSPANSNETKQ